MLAIKDHVRCKWRSYIFLRVREWYPEGCERIRLRHIFLTLKIPQMMYEHPELIIFYLIGLAIGAFITRFIFSIPAITRNTKVQTELLRELALKQGVDPMLIENIYRKAKND